MLVKSCFHNTAKLVAALFAIILLGHLETRCSNSILDTCDTYYGGDADELGAGRKIRVADARARGD